MTNSPAPHQNSAAARATWAVLDEVDTERARQDAKFGTGRDYPDGTGTNWVDAIRPAFGWDSTMTEAEHASRLARSDCQRAGRRGDDTWLRILREEMAEAFAEADAAALRAELIQVAAVAVAWVEAIDRRGHQCVPPTAGTPGDVWNCTCGRRFWADILDYESDGPPGAFLAWHPMVGD